MMTMAERWKQEGEAKGRAEGKAEGRAQGRAESIFAVLAARGIDVSTDERAHVLACQDMATLDRWLARAVTAAATSGLFL
jgi:predicted transposase YdaD